MYLATHDPLEIACCSQTQYQLHFATTTPIAHSKALDPRTTHTNQLKKNQLWECIRVTGRCTEAVGFRYVSFHASEGSYSKKQIHVSLPDRAAGQGILLQGGALNCLRKTLAGSQWKFHVSWIGLLFYHDSSASAQLMMCICSMCHRMYFLLQ